MNVWHVYARYYNFGDYALGVGIRNLFSKYFSSSLLFKLFDTHTLEFNEILLEEMNSTADLLLVGGGGLIHGFAGTKWMFKMPDQLINKVKVPSIIYGVGYNQFRGEPELSPEIIKNLRLLQEHFDSFTVRNDGSREELERLGLFFSEVPDPGFFIDGDYSKPDIEGEYVILQLANDIKHARNFQDENLLLHLSQIVNYLLEEGYKVVLCPHVRIDIELGLKLTEILGHPKDLITWDWFDVMRDENTLKGLAYYKHARFVIGMRGHAQICPIGMGTPVISVGNHRKHLDLLRKLNLKNYYVEVNAPDLSDQVISMVKQIEDEREIIKLGYFDVMQRLTYQAKSHLEGLRNKLLDS